MFHSHYLSTSPSAPNPPESKDEQDQAGIVDLGSAIMDFLTGASRARAARVVLCTKDDQGREQAGELMSGLIFEVIGWSQITRDDVSGFAVGEGRDENEPVLTGPFLFICFRFDLGATSGRGLGERSECFCCG
jgi:hypothetical protein